MVNPPMTLTRKPASANGLPLPPTRRGQEMRERLLAAAGSVFAERGYGATRISDITREAGTAQGNFYRHFQNKNDALLAVLTPVLDELLERTGPPPGLSGRVDAEDLVAWNTAWFRTYASHRRLYRVVREAVALGDAAGFATAWRQQRHRFVRRIADWIDDLRSHGVIDLEPPELVAESLVSMLEQLAYVHLGLAARQPSPARIAQLGRVSGLLWHRGIFRSTE